MSLNRITLKVSCHHIPASHYQSHGSLWDDRERSGFPPFLWTLLKLPLMPDRKRCRERTDEVLLVPWRWCLWTGELKGGRKLSPSRRYCVTNQKWITADFTIRRLLPQSANIDPAKGIPACLTTGECWQSSPQTGQSDEDHNYSCWQANVLKVGLYNIFKQIILAGGSFSQNFELNEELNKVELNWIKDVIDC